MAFVAKPYGAAAEAILFLGIYGVPVLQMHQNEGKYH
jgi:hypothetical protein